MQPLVRRTWAPRGQTPILRHRARRHRKLSVIGALSISPQRRRLGWYLAFHPDLSVRQHQILNCLKALRRHLRGPIIVIWDRLNAHRGKDVKAYQRAHPWLHIEYLPAYAPELNPNEYGWSYLKCNPLANYCPADVEDLQVTVQAAADPVRTHHPLLRSFVEATKLPIRWHLK